MPGELYLSGDCVGNGYYNRSDLTSEKFSTDIFNPNYTMYKTGDLCKFDEHNNIHYLGRTDFQVKINGFRVELEEIEKQIASIPYVSTVSVLTEKDKLDKSKLIAFIKFNRLVKYEILKKDLSHKLPAYMFPSTIYIVENMPLNINGKVDKKLLEANKLLYKKLISSSTGFILPANETESLILELMKSVLNLPEMSTNHDFFELGGDSLTAISLQTKLAKHKILLNTQEIYNNYSPKMLSDYILSSNSIKDPIDFGELSTNKLTLNSSLVDTSKCNTYFLTGVTGYLGIHVLQELLEKSQSTIYCLVRPLNNLSGVKRLKDKYMYYFNVRV